MSVTDDEVCGSDGANLSMLFAHLSFAIAGCPFGGLAGCYVSRDGCEEAGHDYYDAPLPGQAPRLLKGDEVLARAQELGAVHEVSTVAARRARAMRETIGAKVERITGGGDTASAERRADSLLEEVAGEGGHGCGSCLWAIRARCGRETGSDLTGGRVG